MRRSRKYVLGGGLSGLIFAAYNSEYKVISPNIGGQYSDMAQLMFAHANPPTKRLLDDLNIYYEVVTKRTLYVKGGEVVDDLAPADKLALIRKKLDDPLHEPRDLNLNAVDDSFITTYEFNFKQLIEQLSKELEIIPDAAIRISDTTITTSKTSYAYDTLVSTVPADVFWKLRRLPEPRELKYSATTFAVSNVAPPGFDIDNAAILYFIDSEVPYVRVSHKDNLPEFLYEFPGAKRRDDCAQALPGGAASLLKYWINPRSVIRTELNNVPPRNTLFCGRLAQWDHRVKIGNVIEMALNDIELRTMWARQMQFSMKFFDYNQLVDERYREKITKDMVMHLIPECCEVLNAINYKVHRDRKLINVHDVQVEIIDVWKFLLNILITWGISPTQFVELFNEKSQIVEERFALQAKKRALKND